MAARDGVLFTYNDAKDGQIQVGTVTMPWFQTGPDAHGGFSELLIKGTITNSTGATQVFVDESFDGVNIAYSSTDQFAGVAAGVRVNVAGPWCRVRVVQTVAATTAADFSVKASD